MKLLKQHFKESSTVVAVRCDCGMTVLHGIHTPRRIKCPSCRRTGTLETALNALMEAEGWLDIDSELGRRDVEPR